jgi:plastocyanin
MVRTGFTASRVIATIAAAGLVAASCFSDRDGELTGPLEGDCSLSLESPVFGSVGTVIALKEFEFAPEEVRIPQGTRVTWLNCEGENIDAHTSTSDAGEWASGAMTAGEAFTHVFDEVGRFEYHCEPHPFMRGVIIVE